MRGKTRAALGRLQTHGSAHRAVQPWIDIRLGGPCAFVQSAKDHAVCMLQTGFKRPPDEKARMKAETRPHHAGGQEHIENPRIGFR